MKNDGFFIGLDTSNYTTSLAVVDEGFRVVMDQRKSLVVKPGALGLRQSDALYQHMENLPGMLENLFNTMDRKKVLAIASSDRPRPLASSYMPVFNAGRNYAKVMSDAMGISSFNFSHQEGHLEAAITSAGPLSHFNAGKDIPKFIALHLSGGTSEVLLVEKAALNYKIAVIGGTKDISLGQLIDRTGVAMAMDFPCGEAMDLIANEYKGIPASLLKPISANGLFFNLSGMETQCQRLIADGCDQKALVVDMFGKINAVLCRIAEESALQNQCEQVLFIGGVAASSFIRASVMKHFSGKSVKPVFGAPGYSSDNAAGIAILGAKAYKSLSV